MKKLTLFFILTAPMITHADFAFVNYPTKGFDSLPLGAKVNSPLKRISLGPGWAMEAYEEPFYQGKKHILSEGDYNHPSYKSYIVVLDKFRPEEPAVEPVSIDKGENCLVAVKPDPSAYRDSRVTNIQLSSGHYNRVTLRGKATNVSPYGVPFTLGQAYKTKIYPSQSGANVKPIPTYTSYVNEYGESTTNAWKVLVQPGETFDFEVSFEPQDNANLKMVLSDGDLYGDLGGKHVKFGRVTANCL